MFLGQLCECHTTHEAPLKLLSYEVLFYSQWWIGIEYNLILEIYFSGRIMLPKNYMDKSLKLK